MKAISIDPTKYPDSCLVFGSLLHQNCSHNVLTFFFPSLSLSSRPFLDFKYYYNAGNSQFSISIHLSPLHPRLISGHSVSLFWFFICISAWSELNSWPWLHSIKCSLFPFFSISLNWYYITNFLNQTHKNHLLFL